MEFFIPMIVSFAQQYPVVAGIFIVMGILRAIMKPLFALFHAYVDATVDNQADNALLAKIEDSSIFKGIVFVLDYLFSVKLIK